MKGGAEGAERVGGPEKLDVSERAEGLATFEGMEAGKIVFYSFQSKWKRYGLVRRANKKKRINTKSTRRDFLNDRDQNPKKQMKNSPGIGQLARKIPESLGEFASCWRAMTKRIQKTTRNSVRAYNYPQTRSLRRQ